MKFDFFILIFCVFKSAHSCIPNYDQYILKLGIFGELKADSLSDSSSHVLNNFFRSIQQLPLDVAIEVSGGWTAEASRSIRNSSGGTEGKRELEVGIAVPLWTGDEVVEQLLTRTEDANLLVLVEKDQKTAWMERVLKRNNVVVLDMDEPSSVKSYIDQLICHQQDGSRRRLTAEDCVIVPTDYSVELVLTQDLTSSYAGFLKQLQDDVMPNLVHEINKKYPGKIPEEFLFPKICSYSDFLNRVEIWIGWFWYVLTFVVAF